jgi:hypothetical protein
MYTIEGISEKGEILIRLNSDELKGAIIMVNDYIKGHYGSSIKCSRKKEGGGSMTCNIVRVNDVDQMIDFARHNLRDFTQDWMYHSHY